MLARTMAEASSLPKLPTPLPGTILALLISMPTYHNKTRHINCIYAGSVPKFIKD